MQKRQKCKKEKNRENAKKKQKMHVQFQKSCKKRQKCKKRTKMYVQFENSEMQKRFLPSQKNEKNSINKLWKMFEIRSKKSFTYFLPYFQFVVYNYQCRDVHR